MKRFQKVAVFVDSFIVMLNKARLKATNVLVNS